MAKIAIGVLTHNRNDLLRDTIESLFQYNSQNECEMILLDNGSDVEYQSSNKRYAAKYGARYVFNSELLSDDMNKNIEVGHNLVISELLKCDSELFCILEDDWKCKGNIPIGEIKQLLTSHQEIGQVRIRDYRYDDSFYGGSSRHFITKEKIVFDETICIGEKNFRVADMHWVNCCNVMKRDALEKMNENFVSEYEKMQRFYKLYPRNAQLVPGIHYHIGPIRVRDDLRSKGLFTDEGVS